MAISSWLSTTSPIGVDMSIWIFKSVPMTSETSTPDIPKEAARRRLWIISELRLRGLSVRACAKKLGVSMQAVSAVINGRTSLRVETEIASLLDRRIEDLFPERYQNGIRIPHSNPYVAPDKHSGATTPGNAESERAA